MGENSKSEAVLTYVRPGKLVDLCGDLAELEIDDVAWCLAHQARFNGALGSVPTVCSHSVAVSLLIEQHDVNHRLWAQHALAGLLHDAHEALLGDWTRPVMRLLGGTVAERLAEVRSDLDRKIERRFGLAAGALAADIVKWADDRVLSFEIRFVDGEALRSVAQEGPSWLAEIIRVGCPANECAVSQQRSFLARFGYLRGQMKGLV